MQYRFRLLENMVIEPLKQDSSYSSVFHQFYFEGIIDMPMSERFARQQLFEVKKMGDDFSGFRQIRILF
jgi:hypothetical protein